jgi:hypothetical protein
MAVVRLQSLRCHDNGAMTMTWLDSRIWLVQLLIAPGKANTVIKRLAYDAVQVASLHHNDWVHVCQGLLHDLSPEQPLEVQLRVLELIAVLPELHVQNLIVDSELEIKLLGYVQKVRIPTCGLVVICKLSKSSPSNDHTRNKQLNCVNIQLQCNIYIPLIPLVRFIEQSACTRKSLSYLQASGDVQGAAAVALAHCYSQPMFAAPLFCDPGGLKRMMHNWEMVADITADAAPRTVHGGLIAVSRIVKAYLTAKSAREAEHTEDLQAVLAYMAWSGAIRVRVAGAHVLDRMEAMAASFKVCTGISS